MGQQASRHSMGECEIKNKPSQKNDIGRPALVPQSGTSQLEMLPGTILVQIFGGGLLAAPDVARCVNLSITMAQWFKQNEESSQVWKQILKDEELEGETYGDWARHMKKWQNYLQELQRSLPPSADGSKIEPTMTEEEKNHEIMAQRIANFTYRVAGHHSWYKHLPVTVGTTSFKFYSDLTSRMRWEGVKKEWIEYIEGDETEFHYTWMTTKKYRDFYGHFGWRLDDKEYPNEPSKKALVGVPWMSKNNEEKMMCIPKSFQRCEVQVTSAVYESSREYDLYTGILIEAVEQCDPEFVKGPIPEECLSMFSCRRFVRDGKLPLPAALDLEKIAMHILKGFPISSPDSPESIQLGCEILLMAYPTIEEIKNLHELIKDTLAGASTEHGIAHAFATIALVAQQWRELLAIGDSLRDLSRLVYGQKLTPPSLTVQRKIIERQCKYR